RSPRRTVPSHRCLLHLERRPTHHTNCMREQHHEPGILSSTTPASATADSTESCFSGACYYFPGSGDPRPNTEFYSTTYRGRRGRGRYYRYLGPAQGSIPRHELGWDYHRWSRCADLDYRRHHLRSCVRLHRRFPTRHSGDILANGIAITRHAVTHPYVPYFHTVSDPYRVGL